MTVSVFHGHVWHGRQQPRVHQFSYPHGWVAINLDDDSPRHDLAPAIRWLRKRHGPADGRALKPWLAAILQRAGFGEGFRLTLHTLPAVFGRVFNPVSFYLVQDAGGALRAVLAEVSNTFGQRHDYLLHQPDFAAIGPKDWLLASKVLHVSPFYQVQGQYRFRFQLADGEFAVRIEYAADGQHYDFAAALQGRGQPLAALSAGTVWRQCGQTVLLVWLLIHWHAWQLWRKRIPFFGKNGQANLPARQGEANEYT